MQNISAFSIKGTCCRFMNSLRKKAVGIDLQITYGLSERRRKADNDPTLFILGNRNLYTFHERGINHKRNMLDGTDKFVYRHKSIWCF